MLYIDRCTCTYIMIFYKKEDKVNYATNSWDGGKIRKNPTFCDMLANLGLPLPLLTLLRTSMKKDVVSPILGDLKKRPVFR